MPLPPPCLQRFRIKKLLLFHRILPVLRRADAQQYAQERVERGDRAHDLLAVREFPDSRQRELQRAQRGQQIHGDPLESVVGLVTQHTCFLLLTLRR